MTLTRVVLEAARRMMNCELTVDVAHETIDLDGVVFLQGDDAYVVIQKASHLYNMCGDVSMDDCYRCVMEPYADMA